MGETQGARFLTRVSLIPERVPAYDEFPYGIPFVRGLDLTFRSPVTYLVGENGGSRNRAELQQRAAAVTHGEAFLAVMLNRMESGMFVMDEPEAAL